MICTDLMPAVGRKTVTIWHKAFQYKMNLSNLNCIYCLVKP